MSGSGQEGIYDDASTIAVSCRVLPATVRIVHAESDTSAGPRQLVAAVLGLIQVGV